jgi:hypothetical protein
VFAVFVIVFAVFATVFAVVFAAVLAEDFNVSVIYGVCC